MRYSKRRKPLARAKEKPSSDNRRAMRRNHRKRRAVSRTLHLGTVFLCQKSETIQRYPPLLIHRSVCRSPRPFLLQPMQAVLATFSLCLAPLRQERYTSLTLSTYSANPYKSKAHGLSLGRSGIYHKGQLRIVRQPRSHNFFPPLFCHSAISFLFSSIRVENGIKIVATISDSCNQRVASIIYRAIMFSARDSKLRCAFSKVEPQKEGEP